MATQIARGSRLGVGVRRLGRLAFKLAAWLIAIWLGLIVLYRWVDPPITPLMVLRMAEGAGIDHRTRPLEQIAPALARSVIAAEDNRFCMHRGIDWSAVGEAIEEFHDDGRLRGASTITMQLARNLFLWPGGGVARKAIEAPIALTIDALWPKYRIVEVYLNVVEWGPGIYGAEAAAHVHFRKSAARLSRREAAILAAVLPNPRRWSAGQPSAYIVERAHRIASRIDMLGDLLACAQARAK
ncbi:MAG TPA: monofunctional biosynthetic peptidoglycan transglycosylase [Alphaproteobacteria bacterium]|nr:monofunctional biosynthetic peptidoglycan transglycosylase [Alphaproteobacteria bacterium]